MLTFPLHNAALDLKGKPPEELPHGKLPVPPEVYELVEMQRPLMRPEAFDYNKEHLLNRWTVDWYFADLGHEVLYRQTPEGPVIVAVGSVETLNLRRTLTAEEQGGLQGYLGY